METQNLLFAIFGGLYFIQLIIISVMINMDRDNPRDGHLFFSSRKRYILSFIPFMWLMFIPMVIMAFFKGLTLGIRDSIRSKIRESKAHWIIVEQHKKK